MHTVLQRRLISLWRRFTRLLFRPPRVTPGHSSDNGLQVERAAKALSLFIWEEAIFAAGEWFTEFRKRKELRGRYLSGHLSDHFTGVVHVSPRLWGSLGKLPSLITRPLRSDDFPAAIANSIVLVNNNDIGSPELKRAYANLLLNSPTSLFIGWDFDNHHWMERSAELAALVDVYVPAHHDNRHILSRFNPVVTAPVACGVTQWTREFLAANRPMILHADRSESPLGQHVEYGHFSRRNQIVRSLSRHFPRVELTTPAYSRTPPGERLACWCGHTCHWIVPVLSDCPIRVFDALVTGGIPIVPRALIQVSEVREIAEHVVLYDDVDVDSPQQVVAEANRLFRERGPEGILERHRLALDNHHLDSRLERIIRVFAADYLPARTPPGSAGRC